jgi:LmbE family N-acetylglucosaminyl deacetylase
MNKPARALVVMAHPDDAEISCGATMAKWCSQGAIVNLLVLTNGDRGSSDPAADRAEIALLREREATEAADLLGLGGVTILDTPDGDLDNTRDQQERVARAVRTLRPEVVVTPDPTAWFFDNTYYNHSDHRNAGAVTLDAVFPGAGNPHFFADQLAEGLETWDVPQVWLAWTLEPSHREDVSGFMDTKLAALAKHSSQVDGGMLGFFEEWLVKEAAEEGERIGVEHAESFRVLKLQDP